MKESNSKEITESFWTNRLIERADPKIFDGIKNHGHGLRKQNLKYQYV